MAFSFTVTGIATEVAAVKLHADMSILFPSTSFVVDYSEDHGFGVFAAYKATDGGAVYSAGQSAGLVTMLKEIIDAGSIGEYFKQKAA